jgi:hypothetical protein
MRPEPVAHFLFVEGPDDRVAAFVAVTRLGDGPLARIDLVENRPLRPAYWLNGDWFHERYEPPYVAVWPGDPDRAMYTWTGNPIPADWLGAAVIANPGLRFSVAW